MLKTELEIQEFKGDFSHGVNCKPTFSKPDMKRIILSMQVRSSKPAISIEFNDVENNNLAGYEERTRVLYMIQKCYLI